MSACFSLWISCTKTKKWKNFFSFPLLAHQSLIDQSVSELFSAGCESTGRGIWSRTWVGLTLFFCSSTVSQILVGQMRTGPYWHSNRARRWNSQIIVNPTQVCDQMPLPACTVDPSVLSHLVQKILWSALLPLKWERARKQVAAPPSPLFNFNGHLVNILHRQKSDNMTPHKVTLAHCLIRGLEIEYAMIA